jgi:Na+/H+ antiporter NhaC
MPYAVFVAICAAFGIVTLGITDSTILALLVTAVLFAVGIAVLPKVWGVQKYKLED